MFRLEEQTMIIYNKGSVFNSNTQAIVNTVNCVGVMGAGIALEFSLRFPEMYVDYKTKCENGEIQIGKIDYFQLSPSQIICNFPTKKDFKYKSNLVWIEEGLKNFCSTYKSNNIKSVSFPKLGTSNGDLSWKDVKFLMEKYLSELDIDIVICLDEEIEADGKEKEMVDSFNEVIISEITKIRLNKKQIDVINMSTPIKRFRDILNFRSISTNTYKKLFIYFYNFKKEEQYIQQSLLD